MDYLLIMLVIFGIILLISLIILIVRLNFTISKIDSLLDDIAKKIESDVSYPGQIKVNIVRETRVIDYAK